MTPVPLGKTYNILQANKEQVQQQSPEMSSARTPVSALVSAVLQKQGSYPVLVVHESLVWFLSPALARVQNLSGCRVVAEEVGSPVHVQATCAYMCV